MLHKTATLNGRRERDVQTPCSSDKYASDRSVLGEKPSLLRQGNTCEQYKRNVLNKLVIGLNNDFGRNGERTGSPFNRRTHRSRNECPASMRLDLFLWKEKGNEARCALNNMRNDSA